MNFFKDVNSNNKKRQSQVTPFTNTHENSEITPIN
jgi:hypothetical protein